MDDQSQVLIAQIGLNLSRLMVARAISVEELAKSSSVSPDVIGRTLRGEGNLLVDALALLAGALGVAPEELMDGIAWVPHEDRRGGEYRAETPGGD